MSGNDFSILKPLYTTGDRLTRALVIVANGLISFRVVDDKTVNTGNIIEKPLLSRSKTSISPLISFVYKLCTLYHLRRGRFGRLSSEVGCWVELGFCFSFIEFTGGKIVA